MRKRQIAALLFSLAVGCQGGRKESKAHEPYGVGADTGGTAAGSGSVAGYVTAAPPGRMALDPSSVSGEGFKDYGTNSWIDAAKDRLSTFAADVDTASYTIARRKLTEGALPPTAAVRVEEFVNYFTYAYASPAAGEPFAVHMDAAPSPFNSGRHILRVGVSTKAKSVSERKASHLVFLVDVSG